MNCALSVESSLTLEHSLAAKDDSSNFGTPVYVMNSLQMLSEIIAPGTPIWMQYRGAFTNITNPVSIAPLEQVVDTFLMAMQIVYGFELFRCGRTIATVEP